MSLDVDNFNVASSPWYSSGWGSVPACSSHGSFRLAHLGPEPDGEAVRVESPCPRNVRETLKIDTKGP
jgi:hypothetical protein